MRLFCSFLFSLPLFLVSCKAPRPEVLTARASTVPQTTAFMLITAPGEGQTVRDVREDVSRRDRGWWRAGDGSLALKVRTDKGKSLRTYECGGVLIAELPKEATGLRVYVKNLRNRLLDVVVDAQGQDVFAQEGLLVERRGVLINPNQVMPLRSVKAQDGSAKAIPADTLKDVLALAHYKPERQPGVLRFTAFYGAPEESARAQRIRLHEPRRSYEYR
jgi:hypothetical protein